MRRIGILYNPLSRLSIEQSAALEPWLRARGIDVWRGISQECRETPEVLGGMDLLVAMGGDGTVLRAARLTYEHGIPILPVALGHLSFMAEIGPDALHEGLETLIAGQGWLDERAMLEARLRRRDDVIADFNALNEVVISRSDVGRVVSAEVRIDGWLLTSYHADGVLVSTATGSTAYGLAAGGPIIDPRSRALALVPIAAHLTNLPSMILHEDAVVTLILRSRHHANLAVDGRENLPLQLHDEVEVRRSKHIVAFARVRPASTFYTQLDRRLRRDY